MMILQTSDTNTSTVASAEHSMSFIPLMRPCAVYLFRIVDTTADMPRQQAR